MKRIAASFYAALAGAALFAAEPAQDTLIAHRGESVDAPENTLPAYRTAVERGFGFECDVYLSKDGRVFTFHDKDLKRTTGGANTNKCRDVTWRELESVDVGNWGKWKDSRFKGTRPALLEEVLALARDGRQIYFITFNEATCKALKAAMPDYKVYWLVSPKKGTAFATAEGVVAKLEELGVDGVDCHYKPDVVTADYVKAVRSAGYGFHVWTVDDLADTVEAFRRGVQTVTTNCARKQLDEYNAGGGAKR